LNTQELWQEIGRLENAVLENPKDFKLRRELASLYFKAGTKWQPFNNLMEVLLTEFPHDISAHYLFYKGLKAQKKDNEQQELKAKIQGMDPITQEDYQALVEFFKSEKQTDQALSWANLAGEKFPNLPELILWKLDLLIDKNDFSSVLQLLTIQKLKELKDPELYLVRARLLMNTNNKSIPQGEEIEFLLLEALKVNQKEVEILTMLLETYTHILESREKVVFLFKLAETNGVENITFYKQCLSSLLELNEVRSAKELYEVLAEYLPDAEKPICSLVSIIHMKLANIGSARFLWQMYLQRKSLYDPDFYLTLISIGENVLAELEMREMSENEPQDHLAKSIEEAILYSYDMLILLDPNNPEYPFLKGMFLLPILEEEAIKSLKQAISLDPSFPHAHFEMGITYAAQGKYLDAYEHFKQVLCSPVYDVNLFTDSYMNLSEISIKFGWIDEAENYLDIAQQISPKDYRVHLSLGKIYLKESKIIGSEVALDKAEEHLSLANELNPENCESIYYLGQVFYSKQLYLPAIKNYLLAVGKGLVNDKGESFATQGNCYLWISRSYYQMYKDMLFSSRDYLQEAIRYARMIPIEEDTPPLLLEYYKELYHMADQEENVEEIEQRIQEREKPSCTARFPKTSRIGVIKILTVFAPSVTSEHSEDKAIFSKGNLGEIQVLALKGSGKLSITGNAGDSFLNSIQVAFGFAKDYLLKLQKTSLVEQTDILVDIPGWYPKYDGPSAGSGIALAILSAYLKEVIPEQITITGELTLLGDIKPVGGIKEKIEATFDKGIQRVYIPKDNRWDYLDMILKGMQESAQYPEVVPVSNVSQIVETLFDTLKPKDSPCKN
jgi:tetratricopeptide (TPR) repeat protein